MTSTMIYPNQEKCILGWLSGRHKTGRSKSDVLFFDGRILFLRNVKNPIARIYRRKPLIVLVKMDAYGFHHEMGDVARIIRVEFAFKGGYQIIGVPSIQPINKAGHEAVAEGYEEMMCFAGRQLARTTRFGPFWIDRIKDIRLQAESYSAVFNFPIELRDPKSLIVCHVIGRITGVSS